MPDGATSPTTHDLFLECERQLDAVRIAHFDGLAAQTRGLSQYIGERPVARSEAEIAAAASAAQRYHDAFQASDLGKTFAKVRAARLTEQSVASAVERVWTSLQASDRLDLGAIAEAQAICADLQVALTELSVMARGVG